MDKDSFLEKIKQIGTLEDEVERRTALTELTDEVSGIFDTNNTLMEQNKKYEEDNEKLRQANMDLFLKVGTGKTEQDVRNENQEPEKEPRKFEDLFDEKGMIK